MEALSLGSEEKGRKGWKESLSFKVFHFGCSFKARSSETFRRTPSWTKEGLLPCNLTSIPLWSGPPSYNSDLLCRSLGSHRGKKEGGKKSPSSRRVEQRRSRLGSRTSRAVRRGGEAKTAYCRAEINMHGLLPIGSCSTFRCGIVLHQEMVRRDRWEGGEGSSSFPPEGLLESRVGNEGMISRCSWQKHQNGV